MATSLLTACGSERESATRVGIIGDKPPELIETIEAPLSAGDAQFRMDLAQGLVRFDPRGQVVPGLAERWNVSDDGLSYIFRLKSAEWPSGRRVKADEVARVLSRQLRAASKNTLKDTLGAVVDVVAMTDRVIELRLTAPRPYLLQLLAQPEFGIVRNGVGTGPFELADTEELTSEVSDGGQMPANARLISHRIVVPDAKDPVELVRVENGTAAKLVAAFVSRDVDLVLGGTIADLPIAKAAKVPRGALRFDPVAGLFGLMPTARSEIVADAEVRNLLSQAIDRQALVATLAVDGLAPRATLLQAGLEGVGQPPQPVWLTVPAIDRRPALIAEADRLFGDTERPRLRLLLPAGPGGDLLLRRFNADWAPLGISVERATTAASADMIWIDEVSPSASPAWLLRKFRCGVAPICVEEAGPLLDSARTAPVPAQRAALLIEAARLMDEAHLFLPVAAPVRWSLVSGSVPGFAENGFARHTLVGLADSRFTEEY
ncbi:ABC transporter substrate-binding protein [Sphingomonas sp. LY29]|uniref:ABC transporter substrate-binding protein n=1 Tax=Sphingomonas sp. LY29 TaxID=3095341 RepID=UPI002D769B20|nr:ABC transporter substrate-binding protein [Sphingomonas sp. LY29]WRP26512.1 ABC transporter substrate-binding protein [Sphingomonas sp. LY29]